MVIFLKDVRGTLQVRKVHCSLELMRRRSWKWIC